MGPGAAVAALERLVTKCLAAALTEHQNVYVWLNQPLGKASAAKRPSPGSNHGG